ncbi:tetratricopeptide repeat protein [Paenibacillus sp. MZ04-78.2]|uniref:tetratricopeptide repeat protein n=1 Tax=Paenibacillus sp. MZ04-78.2 TaxID=2962034 RepID=UPI0020B66FC3|nr:tetratricopeptide repeat protein [Paenibacillus sp. MZ04-78.2]MCP3772329.1 tetratricopeptide repeat protein [Paenibacillus sp. MZ04-78.2]
MEHEHTEGEKRFPSPEQDFDIYKAARSDGDFQHALYHLACALSTDPGNAEWLRSLNDWIDTGEELLPFVPVEENNYFAVMAVRAYIYARMNNFNEAFGILGQVIRVKPEVPYLVWVCEWEPRIAGADHIEADTIIGFIRGVLRSLDLMRGNERHKVLAALVSVLRKMCQVYPKVYMMFWLLSSMYRRQEDVLAAFAAAKTAYKLSKCWDTAIGMALCFKLQGNNRKAADFYKKAGRLDPGNEAGYLDLGDLYLDNGLYKKALKAYIQAKDIQPDHEWAIPSILYCEYMIKQDAERLGKLEAYYKSNASNGRARELLKPLLPGSELPFVDYIPGPQEASINVLRQVAEENLDLESGGTISLTINYLEAPSAIRALELYLNNFGRSANPPKLDLTIDNVQEPDPRQPIAENGAILWSYEGAIAQPAMPKPSGHAANVVRRLAMTPYQIEDWYRTAGELAGSLTPAHLPDLFAILTHPPEPPESVSSWRWLQHIQYAAVFLMARLSPSKPSEALLSLCYGQSDWPVNAAVNVLAYEAQGDPQLEKVVSELFFQLSERIPKEGHCFFTYALVCSWLGLTFIDVQLREQLEQWKNDLEQQE